MILQSFVSKFLLIKENSPLTREFFMLIYEHVEKIILRKLTQELELRAFYSKMRSILVIFLLNIGCLLNSRIAKRESEIFLTGNSPTCWNIQKLLVEKEESLSRI